MKKPSRLICAGLLLPLLGLRPSFAAEEGTAALRDKATTLFRQGKYNEAIDYYRQLTILQPKNPDTLKDLMWTLWQAHRFRETAEVANRVTDVLPADIEAWNLKARAYQAAGDKEQALKAFQKSLSLAPENTQLRGAIASLEADSRNYDESIQELERIQTTLPDKANIYSRLGQAQYRKGLFGEAAETWIKAAERFPDNVNFQFQAAKSLYYSGHSDQAIGKLKHIILTNPGYWPAVDFLTDDAMARGDLDTVEEILENNFTEFRVEDEPRLLKLANIYETAGKYEQCLKTLNRFLGVNPNSGDAMLMKAECLMQLGRFAEAIPVFEKIFSLNPWSIRALKGIGESQAALHHPEKALKAIEQARTIDPTDPYLLISEAQYLYESGRNRDSSAEMTKWIQENPEPAVQVLLYHGLTPLTRDAMLAYSVHMTTATFEDQMSALQQARYTPVSAEQVDGWSRWLRNLPPKAVMISFDDGRMDSFKYADPILERYGLKATMFAIMSNVDGNLPGYANWDVLQQYQSSGRWQIQAHCDQGHRDIVVDSEGREALFLANRMWLEKEHRLETNSEWIDRILTDHRSTKKKIQQHLGRIPVAFAFPEGEFGQDSIPNSPEAAALNLALARKTFGTAYHQDEYGLNVRSRDSMLLTRREPKQTWTGDQLIRHMTDENPKTLIYRRLLKQASWDEKPHEAFGWLTKLKGSGASRSVLLADEARIRYAAEDYTGAKRFAQRSLTIDQDPDIERLVKTIRAKERFSWSPSFNFWQDNQNRQNYTVSNNFETKLRGNTRLSLLQEFTSLQESATPTVSDNGVGAGIIQPLGLFNRLTVQVLGHFVSNQATTYSAIGNLRSKWTDYVTTTLEGGRILPDTAKAANDNIFIRYAKFLSSWTDYQGIWSASLKSKAAFLTDDNDDLEAEAQGGYRPFPGWDFKGVYRFTIEDTKKLSPDYYSPNRLILNQVGVEYRTSPNRPIQGYIYYLPGVGSERSTKPDFVHDLEIGMPIKFDETTRLVPSFALTTTPTYDRESYNLTFSHQF